MKRISFLFLLTAFPHDTYGQTNDKLEVLTDADDACTPLVTGEEGVELGVVCTSVVGDTVNVLINMTDVGDDSNCCLKETHLCNFPIMLFTDLDSDCQKSHTYDFEMSEMFKFICSGDACTGEMFQVDGHATVICTSALNGDDYSEGGDRGDPLQGGIGQGNYTDSPEFCYGAMYWIMFGCDDGVECGSNGVDPEGCPTFTCPHLPPPLPFEPGFPVLPGPDGSTGKGPSHCGVAPAAYHIDCFCSPFRNDNGGFDDFCWQDVTCFVSQEWFAKPITRQNQDESPMDWRNPAYGECWEDGDCKVGKCVAYTCCDKKVCVIPCNTTDDELHMAMRGGSGSRMDGGRVQEPPEDDENIIIEERLACNPDDERFGDCSLASGGVATPP